VGQSIPLQDRLHLFLRRIPVVRRDPAVRPEADLQRRGGAEISVPVRVVAPAGHDDHLWRVAVVAADFEYDLTS
jgi:hypothetical protein